MKKAKAEEFIDHVQSSLIQRRRERGRDATAVWSVLYELEQASHAAVYIPDALSAAEAARQFMKFLSDMDDKEHDMSETPAWIHAFVLAEIEPTVFSSGTGPL